MSAAFDEARVQRLRQSIQDTDTPDLVDAAAMAAYEAETARRCYALLCDALGQRRGDASILTGTDSEAEVTIGNSYEWNAHALISALHAEDLLVEAAGLTEAVPAVPATWKVNTTRALAFAKKRALDLSPYYTKTETAPRWSFRDRAKPEEQSK